MGREEAGGGSGERGLAARLVSGEGDGSAKRASSSWTDLTQAVLPFGQRLPRPQTKRGDRLGSVLTLMPRFRLALPMAPLDDDA